MREQWQAHLWSRRLKKSVQLLSCERWRRQSWQPSRLQSWRREALSYFPKYQQEAALSGLVLPNLLVKFNRCSQKALTSVSASSSWYWPSQDTGSEVALRKTIHDVKHLTCCDNATTTGAPQSCCETKFPPKCLCDKINNQTNFFDCLGNAQLIDWH